MKRRRFVQALAAAPVVPLIAQQAAPPPAPAPAAAVRGGVSQNSPALIDTVTPDGAAQTFPHFFTAVQFATLQKLGDTLMPPMRGNPGALQCHAAEFLDFLIGVSPVDRKQLYRSGLDALNAQATQKFAKPFAQLDVAQADSIIRPLLVAMPWNLDLPKDPAKHFLAQAHADIVTAARNSPEWNEATATPGGASRRGSVVWLPIDPIYKG